VSVAQSRKLPVIIVGSRFLLRFCTKRLNGFPPTPTDQVNESGLRQMEVGRVTRSLFKPASESSELRAFPVTGEISQCLVFSNAHRPSLSFVSVNFC
jgi:hypothetical protein